MFSLTSLFIVLLLLQQLCLVPLITPWKYAAERDVPCPVGGNASLFSLGLISLPLTVPLLPWFLSRLPEYEHPEGFCPFSVSLPSQGAWPFLEL